MWYRIYSKLSKICSSGLGRNKLLYYFNLSIFTLKCRWICSNASNCRRSLLIVHLFSTYAKNNETFQYCFGVFAGWLALVVCRPHRLGIFSTISKGSDNSNADWYISFQTDEPYTVKCAPKTTCLRLSITNSNLVKDTSYCPILW